MIDRNLKYYEKLLIGYVRRSDGSIFIRYWPGRGKKPHQRSADIETAF